VALAAIYATDREAWTAYAERHGLIRPPKRGSDTTFMPRGNKYGARRMQVDGIWFDSQKEAARYQELKLLREAGAIDELEIHPAFPLHVTELYRTQRPPIITTVGMFSADFRYCDLRTGEIVIEDVKSVPTKTEAYRLRKRLAEVIHGVSIRKL
jgi:hypothetical protein